jgi:aminopeptidase
MKQSLLQLQTHYADLLVRVGLNLQPGQALRIGAELPHADFVRLVVAAAYKAGARYIQVDWLDTPVQHARMLYSAPDHLDFFPDYEVARHRQMVDEGWARLALVGDAFPDIYDDVDPQVMRKLSLMRAQKLKFYMEASMANRFQWCVAAVPTLAWAKKIFPELTATAALRRLWSEVLRLTRADQPDPLAAWRRHNDMLKGMVALMAHNQFVAMRLFDPVLAEDGKPATNLTVGLTDKPIWIAAASLTPAGVEFFPNMPTEEIFSTPHNRRTMGWVRTSKPSFPLARRVENAYFRFEQGEVVEFRAAQGQDLLDQFFQIPGARRLGEIALVDVRSPVNQSGLLFFDTLFDENAVCHIAFGKAYPEGMAGADEMDDEQRAAAGVNSSDTHVDFMIGTATMHVYGQRADGNEVLIMENGRFLTR